MLGSVKFISWSSLALTPYHLNYNLYLLTDWATASRHTMWIKVCVGNGGTFLQVD